jgi:hypothetical protein
MGAEGDGGGVDAPTELGGPGTAALAASTRAAQIGLACGLFALEAGGAAGSSAI